MDTFSTNTVDIILESIIISLEAFDCLLPLRRRLSRVTQRLWMREGKRKELGRKRLYDEAYWFVRLTDWKEKEKFTYSESVVALDVMGRRIGPDDILECASSQLVVVGGSRLGA